MRRLLPVGLSLALGILLAGIAAPADARPHETNSWARNGEKAQVGKQSTHRKATKAKRTYTKKKRKYTKAKRTRYAKHAKRKYASTTRRTKLAHRGITRFARGGATASRTCLTAAARALLGRIEARFGHVHVISTCRPGARVASTGRPSRHASGQAIDFNAPRGRKAEVVRWLIANHKSGGVMTYSGMNHIHVDIGPRFVSLNARGRG